MLRRFTFASVSRTAAAVLAPVAVSFAPLRWNASAHAERTLSVAKAVNKIKRSHQTATPAARKNLELEAWQQLNTLTKDEIEQCEGQSVALILNSWAYFAKFWEHGQDGPHGAEAAGSAASGENTNSA
jgi:hypothetical protein